MRACSTNGSTESALTIDNEDTQQNFDEPVQAQSHVKNNEPVVDGTGPQQAPSEQFWIQHAASAAANAYMQSTPSRSMAALYCARLSCSQLKLSIEQALKVDFTDIFEWGEDKNGPIMLDRKALLLFHPEDHSEELEIITRWLLMHHVEVSSVWSAGCWDYFRQQITTGGSGVIVVSDSSSTNTED
jgi:hypothetical protein